MNNAATLALWRESVTRALGLEPDACLDDVERRIRAMRRYHADATRMSEGYALDLLAEIDAAVREVVRLNFENDALRARLEDQT